MHRPRFFFLLGLSFVLLLTACTQTKSATGSSIVVIESPAPGTTVFAQDTTDVKVRVACGSGVEKVELWINGVMTGQANAPQGGFPKEFPVTFKWMPTTAGTYSLEARGYCHDGTQPRPFPLVVAVAQKNAANTAPSPIPPTGTSSAAAVAATSPVTSAPSASTPEPPTPAPSTSTPEPAGPGLVAAVDLNVRTGPGTAYPKIGVLRKGGIARVTGKDPSGAWWQIEFPPGSGGQGWVAAAYVSPRNVGGVQVAEVPPIPTSAPAAATNPPTAAPTEAPTPAPAGGGAAFQVHFWADKTAILKGTCTNLRWDVEGVQAVYLEGAGVTGHSSKQVCPTATKTYTLHMVKPDSSSEDRQVTITVNSYSFFTPMVSLKPDLVIDSFTGSEHPRCDESYTIHITVKNVGNLAAQNFKVYYYWSVGASSPMKSYTVSKLNAGASWHTSYSLTFFCNSRQTRLQRAVVDPDNQVLESNEGNNSKDLTATWNP